MTHGLFDVDGKVALVTGGTSGIGEMIARGLVGAGARVYVSSRKADACATTEAETGAVGIPADLSSEDECVRLASEIGAREERLDLLVNNAGATWGAPFEEFPAHAWDKVLDLNVKAPFFLTRAFLPLLEAAASVENPARVVNIGSIDGLRVPESSNYSYSASKAAVHQLTRVLAKDLGPKRITVNAIAPGPFPSRMMRATLEEAGDEIAGSAPLGRIGRPSDVVGATLFLAAAAGSFVTGAIIPVDGGIWTTR